MAEHIHKSQYFYGHKISDYGLECGYVDYRTLAQAFDAVLNNEVLSKTSSIGYWEPVGGSEYYYEDDNGNIIQQEEYDELSGEEQDKYSECYHEVFQCFIVYDNGARILQELTDEILYSTRNSICYHLGSYSYGTSWDYVLTDIKLDLSKEGCVNG
jgi:hypothetical protein